MRGAAGIALAALVLLPTAAAAPLPVSLSLPERLAFGEATLLTGQLGFSPATLDGVVLLDATALVLPPGQLVACPAPRGSSDGVDPTTGRCRGGEAFDGAQVSFGERTRVRLNATYDAQRFPRASVSTFVPAGDGATWAASVADDGLDLGWSEGVVGFQPLGSAASTIVAAGGEVRWFNGSDHRFTFSPEDAPSRLTARAAGIVARVEGDVGLTLARARPEDLRPLLEARILLDAQETLLGADAREPIRNVTAILGNFSRAPVLLDAAIIGHLNGTLGRASPDAGVVTLVRVRAFEGRLDGATLAGTADARVTITPDGFAKGDRPAPSPPWSVVVGAWAVLALILLLVPWAPPASAAWARAVRVVLGAGLLVAWDALVADALGFSALGLWRSGEPARAIAPVLAFELVAVACAWALVALPLRLAVARVLRRRAPRWAPLAPVAGTLGLLAVMLFFTHALLNLAFRVAHF